VRYYIRQQAEPYYVLLLEDALEKAGPFIGPRGGKWADSKHTIAWDPEKHWKPKQLGLFEKPKAEAEHQARVEAYNEKQEAKKERFRIKAEKARDEAKARFKAGDLREEVSGIPMGQPVLIGHHSAKRHLRAIERANTNIRRGIEAQKKAEHYEAKAKGIGKAGISSDDPEAVVKLKKQIAAEEKKREAYKKANKLIKKKGMTPEKLAAEMGWKVETAKNVMTKDFAGRVGFPPYILTNMGANIRRMKQRVDLLKEEAAIPEAAPVVGKGYRVEEDKDDNRIRFYFDEKPDREVTKKMKSAGFRWSPTSGAWQRHLNNAGRYAAERMAKELFPPEEPKAKESSTAEQKPSGYRYLDGDKVEYTGTTKMLHGELAYETKYVEGHREGKTRYTYHAPEPVKKSERFIFADPLLKAAVFIGPRGGKWLDPKHTIPWKPEALPGKGKEPEQWGKLPPGKTAKEHAKMASQFIRKHKAAFKNAMSELKSLVGDGEIAGRVKTTESALGKLVRKPKEYPTADKLQDGTGMRVVNKTIAEVNETVAKIRSKYKVLEEEDFITKPQGSYRSFHFIVEGPTGLAMEVQVRTANQNVFSDWSHNVYKPVTAEQAKYRAEPEVRSYEQGMADFMWAADNEKDPPPPVRPPCTKVISQAFGCL
jgi:ppGpp synthetase/RelA/SpoT-type nucleotidyltranferase